MSETKKVKKRKFNFLKFIIFILFIYLLVSLGLYIIKQPIKNIIVLNNYYLSDEEIIEKGKLEEYPSFIRTLSFTTENRIEKLKLVKEVEVKKKIGYIVEINVTEYKILYQNKNSNFYILEDGSNINLNDIKGIPVLINYVPDDILNEFNESFSKLKIEIISKISEIEYFPTDYDEERFIFYMVDGNEVYINISKMKNLNKYMEIVKQLEGHHGILYLDSGNYFEIKE